VRAEPILCVAALVVALACAAPASPARAAEEGRLVRASEIDPDLPWQVKSVDIEGVSFIRGWLLGSAMSTEERPWWVFWRGRPRFVPAYLAQDVETIEAQLRADGYYDAEVTSEVRVLRDPAPPPPGAPPPVAGDATPPGEPGLVAVRILIETGEPSLVCSIYVDFDGAEIPAADEAELRRRMTLRIGDVFDQAAYQATAAEVAAYFSEHGHPYPEVKRAARVETPTRCVDVSYRAEPGATADFGVTTVEGLGGLDEAVVRRELAYTEGEPYDSRRVRETERRLRGLRIFSIVRLDHGPIDAAGDVPMRLDVTRGPENELRLGAGYSTEEGVRGLGSWWNYNLFGGGEQFGVSARISQITRLISATYVEPHFPGQDQRTLITFNIGQDDESTYLNNFTRGIPQIEWRAGPDLAGTVFFRGEYDSLSDVSDPTKEALKVFQNSGFTLSFGSSVRWTYVDDILDPHKGVATGLAAEVAGGPLDADFSWFRTVWNFRGYHPIAGDLTGAMRITLGSIAPYDGTPQIPLWERFYAGGSGIYPVRGYGRRRIGPITGSDDPLGGRTLAIGSIEARYPVFGPVLGVAFVDVGNIELSAWTLDPDNFQTGVGFGLRANSPVGPVEIDLGFGLDRPKGDSLVQVSFSIGPEF
jgi:outer membrane protein assembly complex protein YaeT